MPDKFKPQQSSNNIVLETVSYTLVFLCFNGLMAWLFYDALPIKSELDPGLILIYILLALASYYYFVVNDLLAKRLKGRTMALGFLFAHGAFSFIGFTRVFELPTYIVFYIAGSLLLAAYVFGAYGAVRFSRYNSATREIMRQNSETDALTGIFNRRHFMRNGQQLMSDSRSGSRSPKLSVLMFDLDDFKQINDELGHAAGDEVIKKVGELLQNHLRKTDYAYRWGGEEFLVLLANTDGDEALTVANGIINKVSDTKLRYQGKTIRATVSGGVAQCRSDDLSLHPVIRRADQALYQAKKLGKNQAVKASDSDVVGQED